MSISPWQESLHDVLHSCLETETPLQRAQLQLQPFNNQAEQVQICIEFLKFPLGWKWIKLNKCTNLPELTDMAGGGLGLSAAAEPLRQAAFLWSFFGWICWAYSSPHSCFLFFFFSASRMQQQQYWHLTQHGKLLAWLLEERFFGSGVLWSKLWRPCPHFTQAVLLVIRP